MSPIGKIFIVLNLLLAGLFLGWASNVLATSVDFQDRWNKEQEAHEATKLELQGTIAKVRTDFDQSRAEVNQVIANRDRLQADADRLRADLTEQQRVNSELRAGVDRLSNSVDSIQAQNRDLTAQARQADEARVDADRRAEAADRSEQQAKTRLQEIERTNLTLNNTISDLEKAVAGHQREIKGLETQIAQLVDFTGVPLSAVIAQPKVDGSVLQAIYDNPPGLVAINRGSNDGVQRGFTFDVYSGNQYKGRVRVENVRPDMSTCIIVSTVPGAAPIRQGDSATTAL